MYTNNYTFTGVTAVKIILRNPQNKILLVQEPETNNWMPLHWGLPGGKPTETESLLETFTRKSKGDISQELIPKGIVKIEELLMNGRTVLMFIVLAETALNEISGESANYKWVSKSDVEEMATNEFTEFFNKQLLLDFFNNEYNLIPFSIFNTLEYYNMGNNKDYQSWLKSGNVRQ